MFCQIIQHHLIFSTPPLFPYWWQYQGVPERDFELVNHMYTKNMINCNFLSTPPLKKRFIAIFGPVSLPLNVNSASLPFLPFPPWNVDWMFDFQSIEYLTNWIELIEMQIEHWIFNFFIELNSELIEYWCMDCILIALQSNWNV